ncbi:Lipopolysaccharide biosynthesis protein WzxC [Candidatus Sumerlaea chitinivorans]|uniref:Lipopolysaccharide biosynthesis protein WzxC n=1 Tax=Sumerlaea chitinivorans TaxID=2250252 RepID=A0A2Z4Y314_SUMC1|nr:Lipopolysaccharide biosynthesis protein WzxC [Candidatus Sumerlaea chitinivorans]
MLRFGELTRRVGVVALMRAVPPATALVTNMILARTLSKEINGEIQKVLIIVQVASLVGAFGLQTSLYYFLPRLRPEEKRSFVLQSFALVMAIGMALAIAIYTHADKVATWLQQPALSDALEVGAITVFAALLGMLADPLFIAERRAGLGLAVAVGAGALQVVWLAVASWTPAAQALGLASASRGQQIRMIVWAFAIAHGLRWLAALAFAFVCLPKGRLFPAGLSLLAQQIAYILPVGLTSALDTISSWLDRTLIARFYSSADLAVYTYGAIEIPFIAVVTGAVAPVLLPHFSGLLAQNQRDEVLAVWHRAVRKGGLILFGLFFFFLWLAEDFLVVLYSERYRESSLYFRIYLTLLPLRIVAFMPMLFALGRTRWVLTGALGEIVINLGLSLLLMLRTPLGMAGPAIGTVLATILQMLFYLEGIRRGLLVGWRNVLPWQALAMDFLRAAGWLLPLALLPASGFPSLIALTLGGFVYATYLWVVALPILRAEE